MAEPLLTVEGLSVATTGHHAGGCTRWTALLSTSGEAGCSALWASPGSGKSTVVLALLGLLGEAAQVSARARGVRRRRFAAASIDTARTRASVSVFQDPSAALNPALRIGLQVAEPMLVHRGVPRDEAFDRAASVIDRARHPARSTGDAGLSASALRRHEAASGASPRRWQPNRICCCWTSRPPRWM